jgi:tRNA/rRNA methyltransferase/tRNA (cytidine32/uridine32-2'-O)-methyltransferase
VVSPNPKLLEAPGLHRLAVHSGELLESVRCVPTLEEAVADCSWVVGTTTRQIERRRRISPADVAARSNTERLALVFGDERSGMTNQDLAQCHDISFITSADQQPSLNLSQAVVVYAYELFRKHEEPAPGPVPADDAQMRRLSDVLDVVLGASHPTLVQTLVRSRLSRREAEHWQAALHSAAKRISSETGPR